MEKKNLSYRPTTSLRSCVVICTIVHKLKVKKVRRSVGTDLVSKGLRAHAAVRVVERHDHHGRSVPIRRPPPLESFPRGVPIVERNERKRHKVVSPPPSRRQQQARKHGARFFYKRGVWSTCGLYRGHCCCRARFFFGKGAEPFLAAKPGWAHPTRGTINCNG